MTEVIVQLAECIGRHVLDVERDGLENSKAHVEKINEDARAIHAISNGQEWTVPLHGMG
jgi:hypothetical protein